MVISNFDVMHTCRNFDAVRFHTVLSNPGIVQVLTTNRSINGHLRMPTQENSTSRDGEMSRESVALMDVASEVKMDRGCSLVVSPAIWWL